MTTELAFHAHVALDRAFPRFTTLATAKTDARAVGFTIRRDPDCVGLFECFPMGQGRESIPGETAAESLFHAKARAFDIATGRDLFSGQPTTLGAMHAISDAMIHAYAMPAATRATIHPSERPDDSDVYRVAIHDGARVRQGFFDVADALAVADGSLTSFAGFYAAFVESLVIDAANARERDTGETAAPTPAPRPVPGVRFVLRSKAAIVADIESAAAALPRMAAPDRRRALIKMQLDALTLATVCAGASA